jgi:hypothetical protein
MSERATDLEAIYEALAMASDILEFTDHPDLGVIDAALTLARRLRDAAVVGYGPEHAREVVLGDLGAFVTKEPGLMHSRRCLLIPLVDDPEKPDA